jgi:hypothetical protein
MKPSTRELLNHVLECALIESTLSGGGGHRGPHGHGARRDVRRRGRVRVGARYRRRAGRWAVGRVVPRVSDA